MFKDDSERKPKSPPSQRLVDRAPAALRHRLHENVSGRPGAPCSPVGDGALPRTPGCRRMHGRFDITASRARALRNRPRRGAGSAGSVCFARVSSAVEQRFLKVAHTCVALIGLYCADCSSEAPCEFRPLPADPHDGPELEQERDRRSSIREWVTKIAQRQIE